MSRLSQHGDFPEELLQQAKAELNGELDFAEQQEPLARNRDGMVSLGGYVEQHFDFADYRIPPAPFNEEEIKSRMKALKAERETLKQQYPSNVEKQEKIRKQLEDYSRQLKVDQQAAYAGMLEGANAGDRPPIVGREALMDEIMKPEPKHGKLDPGGDLYKDVVKDYEKYQREAYATQVDAYGALMPAAKQKATPYSGSDGPGGGDKDMDQLVAGSKAYLKAAQGRREARRKAKK